MAHVSARAYVARKGSEEAGASLYLSSHTTVTVIV
jgi:hypothetical protein